jgi:hypothetical protein
VVEIKFPDHRPANLPWALGSVGLLIGPLSSGEWPETPSPARFVMKVDDVTVIDLPPGKLPFDLLIARLADARRADADRYLDELLSQAEPEEPAVNPEPEEPEVSPEPGEPAAVVPQVEAAEPSAASELSPPATPKKGRGGGRPPDKRNEVQPWYEKLSEKDRVLSDSKLALTWISEHPNDKYDSIRQMIGRIRRDLKNKPEQN